MILELWVENFQLDLYENVSLKHVLQINDIAELKDRQASFTNSFNIPKTANNKRALDGLSIPSDTSRIPYLKPNCKLKLEGFDFLTSGWLNVSESTEEYKIYLYSGLINFFKAIENKSLGDLDLSELEHTKNLASVIASFTNPNYKYLITDYNGLTHYGVDNQTINIDYLIPSVNVKYLWDKIHSTFLYEYFGEIFDSADFTNLWLTYPKYIAVDVVEEILTASGSRYIDFFTSNGSENSYYRGLIMAGLNGGVSFTALETAQYKIRFEVNNSFVYAIPATIRYFMSLNQENLQYIDRNNSRLLLELPGSTGPGSTDFIVSLNQGDVISFYDYFKMNGFLKWNSEFNIKIDKIVPGTTSFSDELKGFSIPDFIKEILNRFSLTVMSSEFEASKLEYLIFKERVETTNIIDWSDKYLGRTSEKYTYNNYAQKNYFTYQYNDKEETYHNGSLNINNVNLNEQTTAFASRTYSPERNLSQFYTGSAGDKFLRVFKLYDKNLKENNDEPIIEYKGLDKRFHFVKAEILNSTVKIGSKTLLTEQTVNSFYLASFSGLDWLSILLKYYNEFGRILNDSRLHIIQLDLNIIDFIDFDFNSLFYFAQEQQYYIPNKLEIDYNTGKASGEFIRFKKEIDKTIIVDPNEEDPELKIVWGDNSVLVKQGIADNEVIKIASIFYPVDNEIVDLEWYRFSQVGNDWYGLGTDVSPLTVNLFPGLQRFRLKGITTNFDEVFSNELQYTKMIYECTSYTITCNYGSGEEFSVDYLDCAGQAQTATVRGNDGGSNPNQGFCAIKGSVTPGNGQGQIYENGDCYGGGSNCKTYIVSKVAAYIGDTLTYSYLSCEGQPVSQVITATMQGETMEDTFCAYYDTVQTDSGYIELGTC